MDMYQSGELEEVMKSFETSLKKSSIYFGSDISRCDKIEEEVNGRIQKRYTSDNYYNNGDVNNMFLMFFDGYAAGKLAERLSSSFSGRCGLKHW